MMADIVYKGSRERCRTMWLNRTFGHVGECLRTGDGVGLGAVQRHLLRRSPSFKRVLKVAAAMAEAPDRSLPDRHESWGDIKAAYRFLNNPKVTPEGIQSAHR